MNDLGWWESQQRRLMRDMKQAIDGGATTAEQLRRLKAIAADIAARGNGEYAFAERQACISAGGYGIFAFLQIAGDTAGYPLKINRCVSVVVDAAGASDAMEHTKALAAGDPGSQTLAEALEGIAKSAPSIACQLNECDASSCDLVSDGVPMRVVGMDPDGVTVMCAVADAMERWGMAREAAPLREALAGARRLNPIQCAMCAEKAKGLPIETLEDVDELARLWSAYVTNQMIREARTEGRDPMERE